ncbi:MAG: uncharacterized protein HW421_1968 [Ignavibacteria bacterium]|nr:uncharacterized protein [Ignavibacteria bacterium]
MLETLWLTKVVINLSKERDSMHLEILVEELSARKVLDNLLPRLIINEHTYRIITYQGKPDMLKKLPGTLRGYSNWISNDMRIIILIDLDNDNCIELKQRLEDNAIKANLSTKSQNSSQSHFQVMNRIAIEEIEAWFLGDAEAIRTAYPRVSYYERKEKYRNPDTISGAWETLERILQNAGYFLSGLRKVEVADNISQNMQPLKNRSKSFLTFWDGIVTCLN